MQKDFKILEKSGFVWYNNYVCLKRAKKLSFLRTLVVILKSVKGKKGEKMTADGCLLSFSVNLKTKYIIALAQLRIL